MKLRETLPPSLAGVLLMLAHLLPAPQNGQLAGLPILCPLKVLTAIPCPACGFTRSLVFFAHGDWSQSLVFHPLGPLIYIGLWTALIAGVLPRCRKPSTESSKSVSPRSLVFASSTFGACLLIFWVIRMAGIIPFPANF